MVLEHVTTDGQLESIFDAADYKLVIVDFYADWCGPCRMIAPVFEQLSNYYHNVVFVKVNVDRCRMTCQRYQINAMPTFVLFVRGREVDRLQGANPDRIRQLVELHMKDPPKQSSVKANPSEIEWLRKNLVSHVDHVKLYEDEINQTIALSIIPLDEINQKAMVDGKLSVFEQARYLMDWFHSCFKWVDKPECQKCGNNTTEYISNEQLDTDRAEIYNCGSCNEITKFVRYNNPATLMETKQGRCGEWANAFTLCCRAIGLEARYIHGTEDHVWTEIYDPDRKQWIHCDPCENVIDRPLLYEKGWNKKIQYAFGIARDHVQDVTWRYVFDHKACRQRRKSCREPVLLNCIKKLNLRLQKELPEERNKELKDRQLFELVTFLSPKLNLREEEVQGRTSGDISWRIQRGETEAPPMSTEPVVISPTDAEIEAKSMIVEYDVVNNVYQRPNDGNSEAKGFASLMHHSNNIIRKVEHDWKMVYLCREKSEKSADLSWKFLFGNQKVKGVKISMGHFNTFHQSAQVMGTVCGGDVCTMLDGKSASHDPDANSGNNELELTDLTGAEYIELSINMRGGDGNNAWQQTQIFRTNLGDPRTNLKVIIEFE